MESKYFGNITKIRKRMLARIDGIQIALGKHHSNYLVTLEHDLRKQLNVIFLKVCIIWAQKAGINWRRFVDYNTKYFHLICKGQKKQKEKFKL